MRAGSHGINVPPGWPKKQSGPPLWEPIQIDENKVIYSLALSDLEEIVGALKSFKSRGLTSNQLDLVTRSTFPLPSLGGALTRIRDEVYNGIGFAVIRGWNVNAYSPGDRAIVFLGVSSYIAEERGPQDRLGTMLKHLMDDETTESRNELPFHTDVVADGGQWTAASAWAVYNELATQRPDLINVLAEPDWPFDTFGRNPPYYRRAPLYFHDGKIIFNFSRRLLTGHPTKGRTSGVPTLTKSQAEAIDAVHFTAKKYCLTLAMEEGDIRFVNNMSVLHGREGFRDNKEGESKRHVARIWLRNREMQWRLPSSLQTAWARVFDDEERFREWILEPYQDEHGVWHGRGPRMECD